MKHFPRYPKKAHHSGAARIRCNSRDYYLGKFNSPESHAEYRRLMAEFASGVANPAPRMEHVQSSRGVTVNVLVALWRQHQTDRAEKELTQFSLALNPLVRLFGEHYANDFTTASLETLRDAMISGSWMTDAERAARIKNGKPIRLRHFSAIR